MIIDKNKVVLLVVDMQNGFLGRRAQSVIASVEKLVKEFEKRGLPIVFTRFYNEQHSQYERLIGWTRLRETPETDLHPDLQAYAKNIVDKTIYSAFTPEFISMVESHDWQQVVICGVATDGCVLKSAVDAFERDLVPFVVEDACASHAGEDVHNAGLMLLSRFIGKNQVITVADLLDRIE
jgi:nicotinamidase-related amidase